MIKHALGFQNKGHMPHPESIEITKASENELNVCLKFCQTLSQNQYFENNARMFTPIKVPQENLKQFDAAFNEMF